MTKRDKVTAALPGGVVQFSEEFVRDCEIPNRRVPIASLLQTITEGAAELRKTLRVIIVIL